MEDTMVDVELFVRTSDPETGDCIDCNYYTVEGVPETVAREVDDGQFDGIFPLLFEQFPEDFPADEPGVDAEITEYEVKWP
jgi:hypothetical protein